MVESILFVDDDCMVLNALERTFFETGYATYFALNAIDANNILNKVKIDIVIADIRMVHVSGETFLRQVSANYPDIIRVVLSSYGDRDMMVRVIAENLAQVYILKPWNNATLINQVRHLLSMYKTLSDIKKTVGISATSHLPPMPALYSKTIRLINDNKSLKEVATVIETDPALTANVLRLANSSFYGMTISSVHQALVYLGMSSVKDIILISELFNTAPAAIHHDLWHQISNHMVYTSMMLHGLHQHLLGSRIPDEYSVAGLLADIGRLFLIEFAPERYCSVIDHYRKDQSVPYTRLELSAIGFSHEQLGGLILDWWNFPVNLIESCLYHHDFPFKSVILPKKIIALLHIADAFAWKTVESIGTAEISEDILALFSITRQQLGELAGSITDEFNNR